jgi:hypothetical protein
MVRATARASGICASRSSSHQTDSSTDIEAGPAAADVWIIGYADKPGKDEAMRDAEADVVLGSRAELAQVTERTPVP